jgi:hypothetical protein
MEAVVEELRDAGLLHIHGPNTTYEFQESKGHWFVHERSLAIPVYLPLRKDNRDSTSSHLTVWLLEPHGFEDGTRLSRRQRGRSTYRDPAGEPQTFLVEQVRSSGTSRLGWHVSGVSALGLTLGIVHLAKFRGVKDAASRKAGLRLRKVVLKARRLHTSALDVLIAAGGTAGRRRSIETVYQVAYMTDERKIRVRNSFGYRSWALRRINDCFAYPLYIQEVSGID